MSSRGWMECLRCLVAATMAGVGACQAPREPVSLRSSDPDLKIVAIQREAESGRRQNIPLLIDDLNDEDSAIRFYAYAALRRLTREDFGYHYYEPEEQRAAAIQRWRQWQETRAR